jgi:hypothetical protein
MAISTIARAGHVQGASASAASAPAVAAMPGASTATPGASTATPATTDRDPLVGSRRPWWRRLWISLFPQSTEENRRAGLEQLLALLEAAREELAAGWVQSGWWSVSRGDGERVLATGLAAGASRPESVSAVCLVGALVRADSGQGMDAGSGAGRAVGAVYDALWESRGQPGPDPLAVPSPQVRLAQVRTLTRWNDAEGRTSDEVLAILDRAISRTILSLAAIPAPPGSPSSQEEAGRRSIPVESGDAPAPLTVQRTAPAERPGHGRTADPSRIRECLVNGCGGTVLSSPAGLPGS